MEEVHMECHVVTSFPDPGNALWSGVLEWVDETKTLEDGRHPRILKVQCAMRDSRNGPFLSMPSRKSQDGRYFDLVNIGQWFMDSGVKTVQQHLAAGGTPTLAPSFTPSAPSFEETIQPVTQRFVPPTNEEMEAEMLAGYTGPEEVR